MSLRRALAAVAATAVTTATLLAAAAPARAWYSWYCPEASSTRLLTADNGEYKLWLYQPDAAEVHLCYAAGDVVAGEVVFRTGLSGSLLPTVTPVLSDPSCPELFSVQDPVQLVLQLAAQLSNPYSVCVGIGDGTAVRVTVGTPTVAFSPTVELWLDRYTTAGTTFCTALGSTLYEAACHLPVAGTSDWGPIRVL
jgi:hypothetical protein